MATPSPLNLAFMKMQRRAEINERNKLVSTFVDSGSLFTLLSSLDHQVIYGRRGTGKTHAFLYLAETVSKEGDLPVYIDMRNIGSSGGIYTDPSLSLAERATRLLLDTLSNVCDIIYEFILEDEQLVENVSLERAIDELVKNISTVSVVEYKSNDQEGHGKPNVRHTIRFGSIGQTLRDLIRSISPRKVWILLDEWSSIPLELQPYLGDFLRRTMFSIRGVSVKIAAIEQRTRLQLPFTDGHYVGIEVGADIAVDINLDDFMVFDNDSDQANNFFKELIYKHYQSINDVTDTNIDSPDTLVREAFTQINVFTEFVRASEGVPRDSINIIMLAAKKAINSKISMNDIRVAASQWYSRDKASTVESNSEASQLLHWIIDEVIGARKARAFLLRKDIRSDLIDRLFDSRVLHVLKRNVSSKEEPGVRYDVYKLDYGCYVDLINTQKAPLSIFGEQDDQVPSDDYRAIRRAVLDLDKFADRTIRIPFDRSTEQES